MVRSPDKLCDVVNTQPNNINKTLRLHLERQLISCHQYWSFLTFSNAGRQVPLQEKPWCSHFEVKGIAPYLLRLTHALFENCDVIGEK
jgi:hypothetical protein